MQISDFVDLLSSCFLYCTKKTHSQCALIFNHTSCFEFCS